MKQLYESILDTEQIFNNSDITIQRLYELPEKLKELYHCDCEIIGDALKPSRYGYGGFIGDERLFDILKKYKINKLIFTGKAIFYISGNLKLSDFEIDAHTALEIRNCKELNLSHCKIHANQHMLISCNKLSMTDCEVDVFGLCLHNLSLRSFKFGNSKMDVTRLYVSTSDAKWIEHLKNLGVKKTYTIDWFPKQGEYSDVDPLEELGFKPKQWSSLVKFGFEVTSKDLWGITHPGNFQFCWARDGERFYDRSSMLAYKKNEYFKDWEQYIMLEGAYLLLS